MNETSSLTTQAPENAQRVPPADERESQMNFYVMEWWRLGHLMETADLSSIDRFDFRVICQILKGSVFTKVINGRQFLIDALALAIEQHDLSRDAIADRQFAIETFECGKDFFSELERERVLLEKITDAVVKLDETAGLALVRHVEYVLRAADDDFKARCDRVYCEFRSLHRQHVIVREIREQKARSKHNARGHLRSRP